MNLKSLNDKELLLRIKTLVQNERDILTDILHHLREVDHRKLFSELGYKNLFAYAVNELKYSEGQAGRRIQAMLLIKEIPQMEEKIQSGTLSLTNLTRAQSFFREIQKNRNQESLSTSTADSTQAPKALTLGDKIEILEKLENKSTREGEKLLLALNPEALPKEKERQVSETHTEMKFIIDEELKEALEEVKSLLGVKALNMSFSDLVREMAKHTVTSLKVRKFGKKRVLSANLENTPTPVNNIAGPDGQQSQISRTDTLSKPRSSYTKHPTPHPTPAQELQSIKPKAISQAVKFQVWTRDKGKCTRCGSKMNLNTDHVHPKALGGTNEIDNLRLLCFHCNQRRAMKTFGERAVRLAP